MVHYQSLAEKIESLRRKISEAQQTVQMKRKEAKENVEKHSKAQWILSLCSQRVIYKLLGSYLTKHFSFLINSLRVM